MIGAWSTARRMTRVRCRYRPSWWRSCGSTSRSSRLHRWRRGCR